MTLESVTVWRKVGVNYIACPFGRHAVTVYVAKVLGPVIEEREYDNGYEKLVTSVRADKQGRTYHQRIAVDYFNNTSWRRDVDGLTFTPSLRDKPAMDVLGRLL